ncbi:germination protein GerPD [Calidifontibacillus oryziterrae]|uniref:germination protein GerPD n=1 Tax=Calidifontibacillus oryziterrae TaxID=1191699 RepID=UPI000370A658|nr:germination protein GerPD [Calidifontibacillus oryziterrae]
MNFTVVNRGLSVGSIDITGMSTSSVVLIGDTDTVSLSSIFDTPPESLVIAPFVPLTPER